MKLRWLKYKMKTNGKSIYPGFHPHFIHQFNILIPTHFCVGGWVDFVKNILQDEIKGHVPGCAALLLFTDKLNQVKCSEVCIWKERED